MKSLPHTPGWIAVHKHPEGEPCDLGLGGCYYRPGLRVRLDHARLRFSRWVEGKS